MAEVAETEQKKFEPTAAIEEIGPCKLKVKVEIAATKVRERIDEKYKELNDSVALPGFRKGHAPRSLLERKFGKEILENLKYEMVSGSFEEVKEGKKLEPVGEPQIDVEKLAVEEGKAFAYEFTMEVRPTFELKEYTGVRVTRPKVEATDDDVRKVVEGFREARAELVPAEDGVAKDGDQVTADLDLQADGKSIQKSENQAIFLNESIAFYGAKIPEFAKAFEGKKVGDTVEHTLSIPDSYPDANQRGKSAKLVAQIKSIKRKRLPEVNAEFCKEFDCDTVEELHEYLKKRILAEKEQDVKEHLADQVVDELVKRHDFPMPEGLVQAAADEALQRARLDLMTRGAKEEEIEKAMETMKGESRETMGKTLRAHFILEQIAAKEKIFVTEDQIEERIQQLASRQGVWPHEFKQQLEQQNLMAQLRRQMRQEAVREFLLSKAVVEDAK
jgi:trigger factor